MTLTNSIDLIYNNLIEKEYFQARSLNPQATDVDKQTTEGFLLSFDREGRDL